MKTYLINLITEKGRDLEDEIQIDGHIGLTWQMLIDFVCQPDMKRYHQDIRNTLITIDFRNGDVFHYLTHLANGMLKTVGR